MPFVTSNAFFLIISEISDSSHSQRGTRFMNGADTAWIIVATALVLFMTLPGLALFYGGLVRARNVLSVFMHCYAIACLMSVLWLALGYSIAFGGGDSGYWGGLDKIFLLNVTSDSLSGTLPEVLFFAFQMTFAIITPALIVGAYVERVGFAFVMAFSGLWMLLCYAPVVHWIWGGGMLSDGGILGAIGVRDFAGGIVVHETAGLACSRFWHFFLVLAKIRQNLLIIQAM
jgi:Amt family ammonium transporter